MIHSRLLSPVIFLALAGGASAQDRGRADFEKRVLPVLERFCSDCHADGAKKGGFAFDGYSNYSALLADRKRWGKAVQLLRSHVMPPAKKPKPAPQQRQALLDWIDGAVFYVDPDRPDPGHVALRRLNRAEYNNSVRDVFGVSIRPADQFPPDDSGYGFDNIGDVLALSPMLMEKVLRAAREVVDEAARPRPVVRVGALVRGPQLKVLGGDVERRESIVVLKGLEAEAGFVADLPGAGSYRVTLRAAGARMRIICDDLEVGSIEIKTPWRGEVKRWGPVTASVTLPAGKRTISAKVKGGEGAIYLFALHGPFTPAPPVGTPFLKELLGADAVMGVPTLLLSGEDLASGEGKSSLDTGKSWFRSNGYRHTKFVLSGPGRYRLRIRAGAQQAGDEPVRFELRIAGKRLGPFEVTARAQQPRWIDVETELEAGPQNLQVWFVNAFKDEKSGAARLLWVHELAIDGPLGRGADLSVGKLLARVGRRLYRRPLSPGEKAKLEALAKRAGEPPLGALRLGLTALLASPHFLYWNPPAPAGKAVNGVADIDAFALSARLGAFLWSSAPDDGLLTLAESGKLHGALDRQVERMLSDPRARALTENFAGQWLQLRDMTLVAPDPTRFPAFDPGLAADMRRESELLFDHVLQENRPVTEFLTADYTFVNNRLANHYGLAGVEGGDFRRVSIASTPRRGVLTHASLLTLTSHPTRTAPVKRGKFILERILGTPPPPPPDDIPALEVNAPANAGRSLRKQLEAHRKDPGCASCHAYLDPMGFAFERYDAIGRRREGRVDTSGRLVTGESFKDLAGLRRLIVETRTEQFVRCLAEQLLTYALGRGLEYTDKPAVNEIMARARRAGWRFREMILAVCESVPFRKMRVEK